MGDDLDVLAKRLAELNIDEMGPLSRNFARLNIDPYLYWNDSERTDNCVWVSTARFFNCTVSEFEQHVGMKAPRTGADEPQIHEFIYAIQKWDLGADRKPAIVVIGHGDFSRIKDETFIVVYQRANGTRHCVLKERERFICYQVSDSGNDVTNEVKAPGVKIVLSWIFIRPRHAGPGMPVLG
ncbi:uncharacterized protein PAC_19437 [Phialocephala subalpina]|uniref:Uncharacterized protein n=1 Tax=Phialocephala subalpina TaxID=576137 RepID=A0A1L7XX00_9HELO|nr:uncharacterized protein PAC_19437 [Phialocephala subalpina]